MLEDLDKSKYGNDEITDADLENMRYEYQELIKNEKGKDPYELVERWQLQVYGYRYIARYEFYYNSKDTKVICYIHDTYKGGKMVQKVDMTKNESINVIRENMRNTIKNFEDTNEGYLINLFKKEGYNNEIN